MSLKIISINVRGLGDPIKRRAIFNFYRARAEIICVQETHSQQEQEVIWKAEWGGDILFSHGTSQSRGVCFLLPKGMLENVKSIERDDIGRMIKFELLVEEMNITLCGIYAPNNDSPAFFDKIRSILNRCSEKIIIVGDFNLVMDTQKDRIGSESNNNASLEIIKIMLEEFLLDDIWRSRNNDALRYSWYRAKPRLTASRIDFALISKGLSNNCINTGYTTGLKTDHLAFYLFIEMSNNERGRGYWKMNVSHLNDIDFVKEMNKLIDKTLITCQSKDIFEKWEYLKFVIKDTAIDFARRKTSERELAMAQLSEMIDEYESNLESADYDLLEKTKVDLNDLAEAKAKSCIFRSKARYAEFGEKPTKYFFNLEKSRFNARTCNALLDEDNNMLVTDTKNILKLQESFYAALYTRDKMVKFSLENNFGVSVSEEQRLAQNEPITMEEIAKAVQSLANGKTCGCDGVPIDFYKVFWPKLKDTYFELIGEIYRVKRLPDSLRLGVINLIPQAQKNSNLLKNLRPITILGSDYKVLEKIIANRIEPALETIISTDQRGFMKNRKITTNVRMIFELIKHCKDELIQAIILSLDFMKCFDRIEFQTILKSLSFFGFAEYITQWVEILYTDFEAFTQNNGHFSNRFKVTRGLHQGGPCSSLLFLICAEVMALLLRNEQEIEGISVNDLLNLLGQYADDADLYLLYRQSCLDSVFNALETFRAMSGFALNYDKTSILRIGSLERSDAMLATQRTVAWTNEPINVLGIWVSPDIETAINKNFKEIFDKAEATICKWRHRSMSLSGKILIVNNLIMSLFVYRMMALPFVKQELLKKFIKSVEVFLWNGARPKIPYVTLTLNKKNGGMGLVDIERKNRALKISWIKTLKSEEKLANIVYKNCKLELKELIWRCSLKAKDVHLVIEDPFWCEVVSAWCELRYYLEEEELTKSTILWYNSRIRVEDKPIFWIGPFKKGLIYVGQLYENSQLISAIKAYRLYGLSILELNGLLSAIPQHWRRQMKDGSFKQGPEEGLAVYDIMLQKQNLSNFAYNALQPEKQFGVKVDRWNEELGTQCTNDDFVT